MHTLSGALIILEKGFDCNYSMKCLFSATNRRGEGFSNQRLHCCFSVFAKTRLFIFIIFQHRVQKKLPYPDIFFLQPNLPVFPPHCLLLRCSGYWVKKFSHEHYLNITITLYLKKNNYFNAVRQIATFSKRPLCGTQAITMWYMKWLLPFSSSLFWTGPLKLSFKS